MSFISFFKLVEIQTKVASMIPFSLATVYAWYHFHQFNVKNFIIMFISIIAFDMATTAINNYYDFKKAQKTYGYNYESHNAIVKYKMKETTVMAIIVTLLVVASLFGFLLFLNTNSIILILGGISFLVGIGYSFGPVPISRTPLGELLSGLFMGFVIVFIGIYIHVYDQGIVSLIYSDSMVRFHIDIVEVFFIFLLSLPAVFGIANIMLANNICDIEDDIENKRYTLPVYIGKEKALKLFKALSYLAYVDVVLLILLKVIPVISVIVLITFIPVHRHVKLFFQKQTKKDTFVLAVKNFVLMNIVYILTLAIAIIMKYYLILSPLA